VTGEMKHFLPIQAVKMISRPKTVCCLQILFNAGGEQFAILVSVETSSKIENLEKYGYHDKILLSVFVEREAVALYVS
jgi:dTDP-glucose pyrophosphorylase